MKVDIRRVLTGLTVYSLLYIVVGYFLKPPNMCYENLKEWACLSRTISQALMIGVVMMVFDYFTLKKFWGKKEDKNQE
ncbi:MAG: hypothetical protein Q4B43_05000 [Bacteroidota bacterium]|nr:hypothetical protein [Bacteroidota bacterium]